MLASTKCYQLASVLYSMARRIPYEDVQTAATQIAQCANNVLNVTEFFLKINNINCHVRRSMDHYNNEQVYLI